MKAQRIHFGSRLTIGLRVLLTVALALAAVLLVNWLTARPGIRQRFDLTAADRNTLATATRGTLERLDKDVLVEILYQPMEAPATAIAADVMARTEKLLALIEEEAGGRVKVEVFDLQDREAWRARAVELRIKGFENGLLISSGERRVFVRLLGDIAQVDVGRPTATGFIPPRVVAFTAEAALVEGFLDVTRGAAREAYFTYGYGELDVMDEEGDTGAGFLGQALRDEGFRIHRWNSAEDPPLPDDCAVLGVLGPEQAWPEDMRRQVEAYIEGGGRVVIAATPDSASLMRSDVPDLLERAGLVVSEGVVMVFKTDATTGRVYDGVVDCEQLFLTADRMSNHPLLAPFKEAGRGFLTMHTHQIRVASQPEGGLSQVLATTRPDMSWLDTGDINRRLDQGREVMSSNAGLGVAATAQHPPAGTVEIPLALEAQLETRLVAFGSSAVFINSVDRYNRDLWAAVFNWTTDQDHRVNVSPRDPDLRFLPRDDPGVMVGIVRLAQWWLPLGALLVGLTVAFVRSRGGPRRARPGASKVETSKGEAAA